MLDLNLEGAGKTYDAMVGLCTVAGQYGPAVDPGPYTNAVCNYGICRILINAARQEKNIDEMVEIHGGDNFDGEIQELVIDNLLPELDLGIEEQMLDGPSIVLFSKNVISHLLTGKAHV